MLRRGFASTTLAAALLLWAPASLTAQGTAPQLPTSAAVAKGDANEAHRIIEANLKRVLIDVTWPSEQAARANAQVRLSSGSSVLTKKKPLAALSETTRLDGGELAAFLAGERGLGAEGAAQPGSVRTQYLFSAKSLADGPITIEVLVADSSGGEASAGVLHRFEGTTAQKEIKTLFTNDAVVLGILLAVLALVFVTSSSKSPGWKRFYGIVPSLLLCYFIPSLLTNLRVINPNVSGLYPVARDYLLPASLVLLTLSIDLPGVFRLGPKALIMFFTATVGVVLGGPVAILIVGTFAPDVVSGEVWRGMSTVAGSWIGGGANQAAMKEVWGVDEGIFGAFIAVDVLVANVWMAGLLLIAARHKKIDKWMGADSSAVTELEEKIEKFQASVRRHATSADLMAMAAVGLGVTAFGHWAADLLVPWIKTLAVADTLARLGLQSKFFWIIVIATTTAVFLSFTRFRKLEGAGASKLGSVFLYTLVAAIGMKMDLRAIGQYPGLFLVGGIWMAFHVILLFIVARIVKAPMFFLAVGSKANIGGAASAPIVASAFNPVLAPVGVLLAVVGYALGTYAAWFCALLMRGVAP